MIDLVTPKSLKKSSKKKTKVKSIEDVKSIDVTFEDVLKPAPKRRRQDSDQYQEPESTVPDESFMLPTGNVEFVKTEKSLSVDELTIPSDLDDPNNCQPLSRLIGCQSALIPETHLKCVWSVKRKVLKRNRDTCKCYSELERRTLQLIRSIKILKSKRRFNQHFTEFEDSASKIQCQYPYCKQIPERPTTSSSVKLKATSKLVRKSKKHGVCSKTKSSVIVGEKRGREQQSPHKVRYSSYFINEITRLMLDNKAVWNVDILVKLLQTKQLKSRVAREVACTLIETRDIVTLKQLMRSVKSWTESDIISLISLLLNKPIYSVGNTNIDGPDKQELDTLLMELLAVTFEMSAMKRCVKRELTPQSAKVLLTLINDKLLKNVTVYTQHPNLSQVLEWCEVLIEVYFSTLITETPLVRSIYNNINQHISGCRTLFGLNEYLFRIKHPKKFQ